MMNASTRRNVLSAIIGLGAAGGLSMLPGRLQAAFVAPLRLPDMPLQLVRVLQRTLGENDAITVRRSWMLQCQQQARGIVVTGHQIAAEVSAPPHLAQLAGIEEARDASGMFPLMLSDSGLILTPGSATDAEDEVAAALRAAEVLIAQQPVPADERERYRMYLAQVYLAGTSLLDTLPPDLLFPTTGPARREEVIALPGGMSGSFTMDYAAHPQAGAPWLERAERRVVTRVEGLERSASEVWTLVPA